MLGAGFLAKEWDAEQFAEVTRELLHFQAVRPNVSLKDVLTRKLEWPSNTFLHAPIPGLDRDAVILLGVEPNLRWKTYIRARARAAAGPRGGAGRHARAALLADVPHTRPAPVSAAASDPSLVEELASSRRATRGRPASSASSPTPAGRPGLPAVSLWAAVPHYVSLAPSPRAALALCARLAELIGSEIDVSELEQAAEEYAEQVTEAVASDAETAAYVEELERRVDLMEAAGELPSGESLAAELTLFLRERDEEEDDGESAGGPAS